MSLNDKNQTLELSHTTSIMNNDLSSDNILVGDDGKFVKEASNKV